MNLNSQNDAWWLCPAKKIDVNVRNAAIAYQKTLTKPPGSLGELENIAVRFSAWQGSVKPRIDSICVRVFAADHGVCAKGVSAFPQIVTAQMIQNFVDGGAAISVLSKHLNADFSVVNMGTAHPLANTQGVEQRSVGEGTCDFSEQAAMTRSQCETALQAGKNSVSACDLFIGGEMGIGNTTSASAIFSALLKCDPEICVGRGTGVDNDGLKRKISVIKNALALHNERLHNTMEVLRCLGGFQIAALAGAYIANAQKGIPNLVDGFISTAAAIIAIKINPSVKDWCLLSHLSAEPAHKLALEVFDGKPLLDLGMRLGEGSGAAVAVPLLQTALRLHSNMATFSGAQVSDSKRTNEG